MTEDFRAWFRAHFDHDNDEAGNPTPIADLGINVPAPVLIGGHVIESAGRYVRCPVADALTDEIDSRIVPNTRLIETRSYAVANALAGFPTLFEEIDPPTRAEIKAAADETKPHREARAQRDAAVKAGSIEAPDSTDPGGGTQPVASGAVAIPRAPAVFTADERLELDRAIEAGEIDGDDRFATWVAATTVDSLMDMIARHGDDPLFVKRILIAEETRADTRKTLVDKLTPIVEG